MKKDISFWKTLLPTVAAFFLLAASVPHLTYRLLSNRAFRAKWKDYNDCGLA